MEKKYKFVSHQQKGDNEYIFPYIWVFKKNQIKGENIQNKKKSDPVLILEEHHECDQVDKDDLIFTEDILLDIN